MKKIIYLLIFLVIALSVTGAVYFWWNNSLKPVSSAEQKLRFVISKGESAAQVGSELYSNGLIKNPLVFKIYVQATGQAKSIKPGEYTISPSMGLAEIVAKLNKGPDELWVIVPEGLRREEITERFVQGLELNGENAFNFRVQFLKSSEDKEGYLFPDTYLIPKDIAGSKVVDLMTGTFNKKAKDILAKKSQSNKLSASQIVTLASVIEREAKTKDEKPVIAGILLNRLDIGMGLQVDATVQYAVASSKCGSVNFAKLSKPVSCEWWPILTKEDLDINSEYNSYKFRGLPPAPISNPGLVSLDAAANPQKTDYFFYLHDKDGVVHYAKTLSEHNENVRKYLGK